MRDGFEGGDVVRVVRPDSIHCGKIGTVTFIWYDKRPYDVKFSDGTESQFSGSDLELA